ncbi:hypothetical protein EV192_1011657 [Actinocrispum wychmicini]|uniref:Uncharacterized protein n=1 Tax=Actinocrispum wychmicini TaxID=1213861 RepID=A0A4R2KHD7_9PSEU|nr:hypothetical protein EV192_1011657 [Actinocrispum wychmicini]
MSGLTSRCSSCGHLLTPWEGERCSCLGPRRASNTEVLYAVACDVQTSLHVRDFVRLAERDYGQHLSTATATAVLAPNRRFCWAGKGLYALYRHGPLPGPRNLEEATRLLLVAAGVPLTIQAIDYCLKQLGYRYNVASLVNAIGRSVQITRQRDGLWDHPRGDAAELELRREIPVVPPRQRAAWIDIRDRLAHRTHEALLRRAKRLQDLGAPTRFGLIWDERD